jgi:hypothetical protein
VQKFVERINRTLTGTREETDATAGTAEARLLASTPPTPPKSSPSDNAAGAVAAVAVVTVVRSESESQSVLLDLLCLPRFLLLSLLLFFFLPEPWLLRCLWWWPWPPPPPLRSWRCSPPHGDDAVDLRLVELSLRLRSRRKRADATGESAGFVGPGGSSASFA